MCVEGNRDPVDISKAIDAGPSPLFPLAKSIAVLRVLLGFPLSSFHSDLTTFHFSDKFESLSMAARVLILLGMASLQLSMTPTPVSPEVQVFGLSVRLSVLVAVLQFLPATLGTCLITWVFRAKARELSIVCQAVKDCKTDSCVPDDLRNMSLPNVRNVLLLYVLVSAAATLNSVLFQLDIRLVESAPDTDMAAAGLVVAVAFFATLFFAAPFVFAAAHLIVAQLMGAARILLLKFRSELATLVDGMSKDATRSACKVVSDGLKLESMLEDLFRVVSSFGNIVISIAMADSILRSYYVTLGGSSRLFQVSNVLLIIHWEVFQLLLLRCNYAVSDEFSSILKTLSSAKSKGLTTTDFSHSKCEAGCGGSRLFAERLWTRFALVGPTAFVLLILFSTRA